VELSSVFAYTEADNTYMDGGGTNIKILLKAKQIKLLKNRFAFLYKNKRTIRRNDINNLYFSEGYGPIPQSP
jgi:hypothetical protein